MISWNQVEQQMAFSLMIDSLLKLLDCSLSFGKARHRSLLHTNHHHASSSWKQQQRKHTSQEVPWRKSNPWMKKMGDILNFFPEYDIPNFFFVNFSADVYWRITSLTRHHSKKFIFWKKKFGTHIRFLTTLIGLWQWQLPTTENICWCCPII